MQQRRWSLKEEKRNKEIVAELKGQCTKVWQCERTSEPTNVAKVKSPRRRWSQPGTPCGESGEFGNCSSPLQ